MKKSILGWIIVVALCNACFPSANHLPEPSTLTPTLSITSTNIVVEIIPSVLPTTLTPTVTALPSPTSIPTPTKTEPPSFVRSPEIHDLPGDGYETLFSIPAGEGSDIGYKIPACCGNIEGPNAIAVLPDGSFLISDPLDKRLLNYDTEGRLLKTIHLDELGIGYVRDLRVKGDEIYLLVMDYQKFRVYRLSQSGDLLATEVIPYQYIYEKNQMLTLEVGLTGIAVDCEANIVLEVGSRLLPLAEVQEQSDPALIPQGLICYDKRFFVSRPGLWEDPQVTAGEMIYQTTLSDRLGGLSFIDLFEDGSIYLERDDVMPIVPIKVDQTVHYIAENGVVHGAARVPLSEYYYPIMRNTAVSPGGEVFALLPRPGSIDVIRLNFYPELEPLIPGAVVPQITSDQSQS